MENTVTKLLPIEDLPPIESKEILQQLITQTETEVYSCKEALKALVWTTEPCKIKPAENDTVGWVSANIDSILGSEDRLGKATIQLFKLKTLAKYLDNRPVVKGFQPTENNEPQSVEVIVEEVPKHKPTKKKVSKK